MVPSVGTQPPPLPPPEAQQRSSSLVRHDGVAPEGQMQKSNIQCIKVQYFQQATDWRYVREITYQHAKGEGIDLQEIGRQLRIGGACTVSVFTDVWAQTSTKFVGNRPQQFTTLSPICWRVPWGWRHWRSCERWDLEGCGANGEEVRIRVTDLQRTNHLPRSNYAKQSAEGMEHRNGI